MRTKPLFSGVSAALLLLPSPFLTSCGGTIVPRPGEKCGGATFIVEHQPEAPALLTVIDASCEEEHHWKARLTLENISSKLVHGYEVAWVEGYGHKKDVRSSLGESGRELKSGESRELFPNGGFVGGRSYGKPTGALQQVVLRIARIEFNDGTEWPASPSKK